MKMFVPSCTGVYPLRYILAEYKPTVHGINLPIDKTPSLSMFAIFWSISVQTKVVAIVLILKLISNQSEQVLNPLKSLENESLLSININVDEPVEFSSFYQCLCSTHSMAFSGHNCILHTRACCGWTQSGVSANVT